MQKTIPSQELENVTLRGKSMGSVRALPTAPIPGTGKFRKPPGKTGKPFRPQGGGPLHGKRWERFKFAHSATLFQNTKGTHTTI